MDYIAFIAGLPEVARDDRKLPLAMEEFREQLAYYLKGKDRVLMDLFFLPNDHVQVLRLLRKQEAAEGLQTVYPLRVLEEAVANPEADKQLPSYLREFIADYKEERLRYEVAEENVLSWMYYDYMMQSRNRLVREYAEFVMNVRNLVAALNARKYGREVTREVIGDNDFAQALRTSNAKDFGLAQDYEFVDRVISLMNNDDLVVRERGLDMLIWDFLDEAVTFEYFSVERVMAYLLQLLIVERWSKMDSESGRKVFREMVERLRKSFQFDEQFK